MGSSRLPGKILMPIGNKTLLAHIIYRLSFLKQQVKIVLATSVSAADDVVEAFCIKNNITCFRGSESDVLERYYLCAKQFSLDPVIRLTADNPFVDVEELDQLIDLFDSEKVDYAHSFGVLPVGLGAEIFSFRALEESFRKGQDAHHREHVNEYIQENPSLFITKILKTPTSKNHPELRLTVDTPEDYRKACFIAEHAKNDYITTEEAIRLCSQFA